MKAVIFRKHGGPDQLTLADVPDPKPGPEDVIIRVKACALNHLDVWARQGMPNVKIPLPHILGCDISGRVAECGKHAKGVRKGMRAVVAPGISCGHCYWCKVGWDSLCEEFKIVGFQVDGGYAEYVKVPARNVVPINKRYTFEEWAAAPLVFLTAWHALVTRAQLKKGESVLIHSAGSGVGSAAIQIAKYLGAKIFTTVGTDAKEPRAKALGADRVINYKRAEFAKEVRRLTDDRGVDVVIEHIGAETFPKSLAALSKKGRLITLGVTTGGTVELNLRPLFMGQQAIVGSYMGGRIELNQVIQLLKSGRLKPVVDQVVPLAHAPEAHERLLARKNFGKIVLRVSG